MVQDFSFWPYTHTLRLVSTTKLLLQMKLFPLCAYSCIAWAATHDAHYTLCTIAHYTLCTIAHYTLCQCTIEHCATALDNLWLIVKQMTKIHRVVACNIISMVFKCGMYTGKMHILLSCYCTVTSS